jgi:hypothetical protein
VDLMQQHRLSRCSLAGCAWTAEARPLT